MRMAQPVISPAYRQIVEWYQHWQTMETAKPIKMLGTTGAPDEGALGPTEADGQTKLDIYV